MAYSILDYNKALNNGTTGYLAPIGPSKPGYIQGTANRVQDTPLNRTLPTNVYVAPKNATTGGGGGGQARDPHINPSTGVWDDEYYARMQGNANSARDSMLSAIQRRLDETRNLAKQKIQNATGTRDYVVNFINERFPQLIDRAKTAGARVIEDLSGQESDLNNLYARATAQARRRSESAALKNRNIARAGNRLGSSFYDETVAENQENLGRQLGESDLEKISKIAAIGTQKTRANQDTENVVQDLEMNKNQATFQAIDEYKRNVQEAEALERAGVLDFGEGVAEAEANLQARLDSINQWAQGMAMRKQELAATYGAGGAFDTRLEGMANTNNAFIQQNAATPKGTNLLSYAPTTMSAGANQPTNISAWANQGVDSTDDILKRLGLA